MFILRNVSQKALCDPAIGKHFFLICRVVKIVDFFLFLRGRKHVKISKKFKILDMFFRFYSSKGLTNWDSVTPRGEDFFFNMQNHYSFTYSFF